jgi:hypothetical protein
MNIVLIILGSLAGLILLLLIIALFVKKELSVRREIIINRPVAEVYDYVRFLKNQDYYSKWVMTDPNMKKIFKGTDGTVGFVYGWDGNKQAGEGEQEIMALKPNKLVDIEVRFVRPFKNVGRTPMQTVKVEEGKTKVIWGMDGHNPYPMNLMNAMMQGMLAKDVDISLNNLKTILEKKA